MRWSPGLSGWVGVGLVVGTFDGWAVLTKQHTMSAEFRRHREVGVVLLAALASHLILTGDK